MRIMVFFDIPVKTKPQQRIANGFRQFLLKDGYHMVQYSVYAQGTTTFSEVITNKRKQDDLIHNYCGVKKVSCCCVHS